MIPERCDEDGKIGESMQYILDHGFAQYKLRPLYGPCDETFEKQCSLINLDLRNDPCQSFDSVSFVLYYCSELLPSSKTFELRDETYPNEQKSHFK